MSHFGYLSTSGKCRENKVKRVFMGSERMKDHDWLKYNELLKQGRDCLQNGSIKSELKGIKSFEMKRDF